MHCSSEGVLVQEVRSEEVVEVGGGNRGLYVGVIYIVYIRGKYRINIGQVWVGGVYSGWRINRGESVVETWLSIYRGGTIYRSIYYSMYIGGSIYSQFTNGDMLHVGYMSSRSSEIE